MTTFAPRPPIAPVPAPSEASSPPEVATSSVTLRLWRPTSTAVVVHVAGDLDVSSAPRLHELLAPRLTSTAETVVLDFSELGFMGVAGLELLAHARRRAANRAMTVCLVDGPVCVDRALRAAGWTETVPTYPTLAAAVADLPGCTREVASRAAS